MSLVNPLTNNVSHHIETSQLICNANELTSFYMMEEHYDFNMKSSIQDTFNTIFFEQLKVQSCKLYTNKYMIASTQLTNTEIFAFMAVLVFKLLSRKVLFINRKRQ